MSTILKNPLTDHLSFLSDELGHLRSNRTSKSDRLLAWKSHKTHQVNRKGGGARALEPVNELTTNAVFKLHVRPGLESPRPSNRDYPSTEIQSPHPRVTIETSK